MNYLEGYIKKSKYPKVQTIDETIDRLLKKRVSLARFGDGEFMLCFDRSITFQKSNKVMRNKLRAILKDVDNDICLIGLLEFRVERLTLFWKQYWFENVKSLERLTLEKETYFNSSVTREVTLEQIERLKQVWEGRNAIFVVGKGSRFDIKHELFDNLKDSLVIYGLPINAWDNYDEVLAQVRKESKKRDNPIVLCALGPTATVLVYDLAQEGIQGLDLGHLPNVYDKLKYNAVSPEKLSFVEE